MQKNSFKTPLDDYSLLRVEGDDALSFLQGQLSCDVKLLTATQSSLGCCCDRKGRVLFSFRIFIKDGVYYLHLPHSMAQNALQHLHKYLIIAKVNLQIEKCSSLGLSGSHIKSFLNESFSKMPQHFGECQQHSDEVLICVDEANSRYLLISTQPEKYSSLAIRELNDWQYADIQQGLVTIYPETQGLFIPQMLNYEKMGAISFTKGCFVGQEIIARTQHLGRLKRHLHSLTLAHVVHLGEEITENHQKGVVAAVCLKPDGNYAILAVMQD